MDQEWIAAILSGSGLDQCQAEEEDMAHLQEGQEASWPLPEVGMGQKAAAKHLRALDRAQVQVY